MTIIDNGSFRKNQFNEDVHKVLVNKGTISTLALWKAGYNPYDIKTQNVLNAPNLVVRESTQTSLTIGIDNIYEGYNYTYEGSLLSNPETPFIIKGLYPNEQVDKKLKVSIGDYPYTYEVWGWWYSNPISPEVRLVNKTASSFELIGEYIEGDAIVHSKELRILGSINENIEGNSVIKRGLNPKSNYQVFYEIEVSPNVSSKTQKYQGILSFVIDDLKLNTQQPKVVSVGNVIVAAESNLDDEETNVGFEWRRTDWSDDFASNKGGAYLYEGVMEGYIRNLYAEKLWKYRPYYISDSGKTYYGEWVGLDPTNTSYFEPTVHTYAKVDVSEGTATLNGYVMTGTDAITEQGFEYWTLDENNNASRRVPQNVKTVVATGQHMTATLTDLIKNTTYFYRAYVKTANNTTYGEERSFKTPSTTGIEQLLMSEKQPNSFNVYTISGSIVRYQAKSLEGLPRGIYIVNRKKVFVK